MTGIRNSEELEKTMPSSPTPEERQCFIRGWMDCERGNKSQPQLPADENYIRHYYGGWDAAKDAGVYRCAAEPAPVTAGSKS